MSFSQSLAWTHWCATNPWDCVEFENDANVAIAALKATPPNTRPAEKFVEKWQQIADRNEATALAIQEALDNIRSSLTAAARAPAEILAEGFKPLIFPALVVTAMILAWKN